MTRLRISSLGFLCWPNSRWWRPNVLLTCSTVRFEFGKAGLFSAAGHEHWVTAPIASGAIDEGQHGHIKIQADLIRHPSRERGWCTKSEGRAGDPILGHSGFLKALR